MEIGRESDFAVVYFFCKPNRGDFLKSVPVRQLCIYSTLFYISYYIYQSESQRACKMQQSWGIQNKVSNPH